MVLRLFRPIAIALQHRALLTQLVKRELGNRYQGTLLGGFWSLLNPLLMLVLYTFVFKVIFKARWPDMANTNIEFASILFIGLLVHGFLAEVLARSSTVIVENANYVKKIVFPLPILAWNIVLTAFVNMLLGLLVLLVFMLCTANTLSMMWLLFPIIIVPLLILALGLCWLLSAIAVYFRDLALIIPPFSTLLLFSSTTFFPLEQAPEIIQPILRFNPLTIIIDSMRDLLIYERLPKFDLLVIYSVAALILFWFGYYLFARLSRGFSDVL
jgi:lipopolysaccharide transport system permease protein